MKKILLLIVTIVTISFYGSIYAVNFDLNSKYVYVYNPDENKVLYELNSDDEVKVASMTKIMTSIIIIENNSNLNKKITIEDEDLRDMYEYATAGFQEGYEVTIKELLYGILLQSGSDAVNAGVRITSDNEDDFVDLMNKKVKELNLTHTHFSNPIGKDDGNYSSAEDIAKIMEYCLKNKDFKEIVSTDMYYIDRFDLQINGPIYKADSKYNADLTYIKGGKNGYTALAGYSLVSYGEKDDTTLIIVTNKAGNFKEIFEDNNKLYSYFFENYGYKPYNINFDIDIKNGKEKKYNVDINTKLYLENDYDENLITYEYKGTKKISILNRKGDKLGKVNIYYNNELIKEVDVRLNKNIKYKVNTFLPIIVIVILIIIFGIIIKKKVKPKKKKIVKKVKTNKVVPKKEVTNKVETFIKEENSLEKKLNILKTTTDLDLFFNTLKSVNYTSHDKENFEHDFIDRCFKDIDFKNVEELKELYTKLKLYKSKMSQSTIKYYNKLFKYCIEEYIDKD